MGIAVADVRARSPKLMALFGASAALLCLVPPLEDALPQALLAGMSHTALHLATFWIIPALLLGLLCAFWEKTAHRDLAVAVVAAGIMISVGDDCVGAFTRSWIASCPAG